MMLTSRCLVTFVFAAFFIPGDCFNLTIMHTNDVHSRFDPMGTSSFEKCTPELSSEGQCFGGLARRVAAVKSVRERVDNTILLDAGDQLQGTLWYYVYRGAQTAFFMNNMSYDAMAIGTHEFDLYVDGLAGFLDDLVFPGVACNVDATQEPVIDGKILKSTIRSIGGERIGIVGYTSPDNVAYSRTGNLLIGPIAAALQEEVNRLTNEEGVNKIIALGHADYDNHQEIARTVRGVDIVVGGRTSTFLYTGDAPSAETPKGEYPLVITPEGDSEGKVLVVTAYRFGKYLGILDVVFDDEGRITAYGGNPLLLDASIQEDQDTLAILAVTRVAVDELSATKLAVSVVNLALDLAGCGTGECNGGNHFAEAMLAYQLANSSFPDWSPVSMAIINADSFYTSVSQGDVTFQDVMDAIPYGDSIDVIELRGEDVIKTLEVSAAELNADASNPQREFLQVAGLQIVYDLTKEPGERVVSAKTLCSSCTVPRYEPVDMETVYKVVVNNYMATGGAGYGNIRDSLISRVQGPDDIDVWADYFRKNSPVWTAVDGRITFINGTDGECGNGSGGARSLWPAAVLLSFIMVVLIY